MEPKYGAFNFNNKVSNNTLSLFYGLKKFKVKQKVPFWKSDAYKSKYTLKL